jgi:dolichol-phosphate mannosyltransferase
MPRVSVVIPCYFNACNIPDLASELIENESLFESNATFEYILIDDDSGDRTWQKLKEFKADFPDKVTVLKLARNVGSYNAIYLGLERASGDCVVIMAADLQDPPSHIKTMYDHWQSGHKLVLANRENSTFGTRQFFSFLRTCGLANLPEGGFDFCLFDKALKQGLIQFDTGGANSLYQLLNLERFPKLAPYIKQERRAGKSRWTIWKKLKLALNTIERYSKFRLVHVSLMCLIISTIPLLAFNVVEPSRWIIAVMVMFMLAAILIEILRTVIRGTKHDLANIIEEVI